MSQDRNKEQPQQQPPQARGRATLLLTCFWMIVWGIILGALLYAFQILSPLVLLFAAAAAAIITVIGVLIGLIIEPPAIRGYFGTIWKNANRTLSVWGGLFAVIIILGGSYVFTFKYISPLPPEPTSTTGQGVTPNATQGPKWVSILKQRVPNCNNPPGAVWYVHTGGTRYTCSSSGGLMEQTTSSYYAEVDLMKVQGSSYDQTNFLVQYDIAFQNPNDPSTWAAVTVQSPADINVAGGYIFTLSPSGAWTLQQVVSATNIPTVKQATVNIDPRQVVQMKVIVQNDILSAYINGQQVTTIPDNLSMSPSVVGLMVERQNLAPSSLVEFSNFDLDKVG